MMSADCEVISFGDDEDDDDDMLDLFSFGAETPATTVTTPGTDSVGGNNSDTFASGRKKNAAIDFSEAMKSVMPLPPSNNDDENSSNTSGDSFIELLEQQQKQVTTVVASALAVTGSKIRNAVCSSTRATDPSGTDSNMQDILDWLHDDDDRQSALESEEEELVFVEPPRPHPLAESLPQPEPPPPSPKEYDSLEEAVKAHDSTVTQIRRSLEKEQFLVEPKVRPWLWAKVICGKTLQETLQSSIADSFHQWEQHWRANENSELRHVSLKHETKEEAEGDDENGDQKSSAPQQQQLSVLARKREWLEEQSKALATRIAKVSESGDMEEHEHDLFSILMNHEGSRTMEDDQFYNEQDKHFCPQWKDQLLPPVASAILSAGVPKVAAAVMLSQIISKFMPIVSLSVKEREKAGWILHQQFYLLCGYHLPLLKLHLDKYIPGWYKWPPKGKLPQSWLISHLAGEADCSSMMHPQLLLCLWDLILTSSNNSLRFFLVMALLDRHAERLLLLTDDSLIEEFRRVVTCSSILETNDNEFSLITGDSMTNEQANNVVREWSDKAVRLWEETPLSVTRKLKRLEDEAVNDALVARQKAKEERLRLKQETEVKAQQEALEAVRERRADEARLRLTRARLVAFYRQYNPGKETNIDRIMTSYEGRYDILDSKLKQKYGVGFNPALKPKAVVLTMGNSNILSTMNSGFGGRRAFGKRKEDQVLSIENLKKESPVVEVSASEVLPIICWSKEANQIKIQKLRKSCKLENEGNQRLPLKFYLVDSRPESSAREQGRIPTSVCLTPDQLVDNTKSKEQEDMFESLRGTAHICVMGEGYSALPQLYGHKMTKGLAELIKADEKRVNECALFFVSRGFPFVSILEGGFASAHSYLYREGPKDHLRAKDVLTDYDTETSIFAEFERLNLSSGREKAQRSLQYMFDSGMTALTKSTMRFETLSSEVSSGTTDNQTQQKGEQRNVVRILFGGGRDELVEEKNISSTTVEEPADSGGQPHAQPSVPFRNPFAWKSQASNVGTINPSQETSSTAMNEGSSELKAEIPDSKQPDGVSSVLQSGVDQVSQKTGALGGFGSAVNNSIKPSSKSQQPRNPFARFGNLGSNSSEKNYDTKVPGMVNHFAGLNPFRKNTIGMMKSGDLIPPSHSPQTASQSPPEHRTTSDSTRKDDSVESDVVDVLALSSPTTASKPEGVSGQQGEKPSASAEIAKV